MKNNILVIKSDNSILISNNGRKLILDLNERKDLKNKTENEIKELYLNKRL